ncbi:MAG: ABC transporter substrate-binding protein [Phycisphaerae bacterium]|nr:ABC transporter substrate-binding protein [Phycisphaerae bacterium]
MRISKTFTVALILFALSLGISGLLNKAASNYAPVAEPDQSAEFNKKQYKRIICFSALCTEIAFGIGAADKIVGVSKFSNWPPEAATKPIVGDSYTINSEQVTALKPDLVIVNGKAQKVYDFCKANNIEILRIDIINLDKLYSGILTIGKKLGHQDQAQKLCQNIVGELNSVRIKVAGLPKRSVFICLYRQPGTLANLSTVGANTVTSELINIAGGDNIFSDLKDNYKEISKETLLKRKPEIIIDPQQNIIDSQTKVRLLNDWTALSTIPAVQNHQVYFPVAYPLLIPGTRIGQNAMEFARMIHPEAFND